MYTAWIFVHAPVHVNVQYAKIEDIPICCCCVDSKTLAKQDST